LLFAAAHLFTAIPRRGFVLLRGFIFLRADVLAAIFAATFVCGLRLFLLPGGALLPPFS
jgi:hypothetical protein